MIHTLLLIYLMSGTLALAGSGTSRNEMDMS
jgi:hypothetical protein